MATSESVTAQVDQLIDLFNRRSPDLPNGLFTRHTQFVLNGVPFEERLGHSPSDPLVLMLARGAAGYRFAAKAIQHALPDARVQRGELLQTSDEGQRVVRWQCWLSGHFRGTGEPAEILVDAVLQLRDATVVQMTAAVDERALARLQAARLSP